MNYIYPLKQERKQTLHHITRKDWLITPDGNPRGYIQSHSLKELWFHTGTNCNLGCHFCLEGSGPGNNRIEELTFEDVRPIFDEAITLGVEQFSFTGGEPFTNRNFIKILNYALDHRPCLVLTNGTAPIRNCFEEVKNLIDKPHSCKFRISLDHPDPEKHDEVRGQGNFSMALYTLMLLHNHGFAVSIARLNQAGEDYDKVNKAYQPFFKKASLPLDTNIVTFPELHPPGSNVKVPYITENCMTTYKNEETRRQFMCSYSRMVVKKEGKVGVYACTLVDDDADYNLGTTLSESLNTRVMLKHHRCYSCFASNTSCSESQ